MKWIFKYFKLSEVKAKNIIFLTFLSLLSFSFMFVLPFFIRFIFDKVIPTKDINLLIKYGIILISLFFINSILNILSSLLGTKLATSIYRNTIKKIIKKSFKIKLKEFRKKNIGARGSLIIYSAQTLNQTAGNFITFLVSMCSGIAILAYLFYINIFIALITTFSLVIIYLNYKTLSNKIKKVEGEMIGGVQGLSNFTIELFNNIDIVKAYLTFKFHETKLENVIKSVSKSLFNLSKLSVLNISLIQFFLNFYNIFLLLIGIYISLKYNRLSIGSVIAVYMFIGYLFKPIQQNVNTFIQLGRGKQNFEVLNEYLNEEEEHLFKGENIKTIKEVEFKNVNFSYLDKENENFNNKNSNTSNKKPNNNNIKNNNLILNNLNFKFEKGTIYGIKGKSGIGKTTIAELIMRFYDPNSGEILYNGESYKKFSIASIRKRISYIPQKPFLWNDTLKENILYGCKHRDKIDDDYLNKLLKFLGLNNKTLDMIVEEKGNNLSGGEQQRISFARAMLRNSDVFIFDEPTSSLDSENSKKIRELIMKITKLYKNKIIIIISHKIEDLNFCDKVLELD